MRFWVLGLSWVKDIDREQAEADTHRRKSADHEARAKRLFKAAGAAIDNGNMDGFHDAMKEAEHQGQLAVDELRKATAISDEIIGKCHAIHLIAGSGTPKKE